MEVTDLRKNLVLGKGLSREQKNEPLGTLSKNGKVYYKEARFSFS